MVSLDVGCGNRPRGDVNVDFRSSPQWKRYEDKLFICCDAHCLPLRSKIFDAAFCFLVLPYVHNETQVVRELNRVLKTNGRVTIRHNLLLVYLRTFFKNARQPLNIARRIYLYMFRHNVQNSIINTFQTRRGMANLLRNNNFTVKEIRRINDILHIEARRKKFDSSGT